MATRVNFFLASLVAFGFAAPAAAQGPGVRGGVSVDPDQVYFGGHYETSALVDRLHFRPNIELGLGDDLVTTALNMEFVYKFPRGRPGAWRRATVNFYSWDDEHPGHGETTRRRRRSQPPFGVERRPVLRNQDRRHRRARREVRRGVDLQVMARLKIA
jgi:hypothetical protein